MGDISHTYLTSDAGDLEMLLSQARRDSVRWKAEALDSILDALFFLNTLAAMGSYKLLCPDIKSQSYLDMKVKSINRSAALCELLLSVLVNFPLLSILSTNILLWEIWHLVSIIGNGCINIALHTYTHWTNDTLFTVARKRTLGFTPVWLPAPVERRVGAECSQSKVNYLSVWFKYMQMTVLWSGNL